MEAKRKESNEKVIVKSGLTPQEPNCKGKDQKHAENLKLHTLTNDEWGRCEQKSERKPRCCKGPNEDYPRSYRTNTRKDASYDCL